jgi:hypothetical protein
MMTSSANSESTASNYGVVYEDSENEKEIVFISTAKIMPYAKEPIRKAYKNEKSAAYFASTLHSTKETKKECLCGKCSIMATELEQICCHHHDLNFKRRHESMTYKCITEHPMFHQAVLNPHAQELAWRSYADQYGRDAYKAPNENDWRRHIAYGQAARWARDRLGINVKVLPACLL